MNRIYGRELAEFSRKKYGRSYAPGVFNALYRFNREYYGYDGCGCYYDIGEIRFQNARRCRHLGKTRFNLLLNFMKEKNLKFKDLSIDELPQKDPQKEIEKKQKQIEQMKKTIEKRQKEIEELKIELEKEICEDEIEEGSDDLSTK